MRIRWTLLVALVAMLAARAGGAVEVYDRKVLFALRYGAGAGEIRMVADASGLAHGPDTFAVDGKGDILLGNRASRLVKIFSPSGKLLAMTACDAQHLAADPEGNFYALVDYRAESGERTGLKVSKYDPKGKLLFSLYPDFFRAVLDDDGTIADWPRGIETDSAGNLICRFAGKTAKLSSAGKYLELVSGLPHNVKGDDYNFAPDRAAPGAKIHARRSSATSDESTSFPLTVRAPNLKHGERLILRFYQDEDPGPALAPSFVDDAGSIYLAADVELSKPVTLMSGALRIPGRHVVQKYSPSGKFLSEMQFMAEPTGEFVPYEITRKGELYQLDYRDDHMDVVKWTPRTLAPMKQPESRQGKAVKGKQDGL